MHVRTPHATVHNASRIATTAVALFVIRTTLGTKPLRHPRCFVFGQRLATIIMEFEKQKYCCSPTVVVRSSMI